jgi:DNA-binding NarL/FixJ family response regulator
VLLADGEQLVRAGLRALLEDGNDIIVAAEAASGHQAVVLASVARPDVVLMNARMPGLDGVQATRRITAHPRCSGVGVLLLSDDERCDEILFGAFHAGASGFMITDTEPGELRRAVRVLASGGVHLSPSITRRLVDEFATGPGRRRRVPEPFEQLTPREREVVTLAASGLANVEIAEWLGVSPATAKTHVSRSMGKLHVRDRAKLVALAYRTGFAQPACDRRPDGEMRRRLGGVAFPAAADRRQAHTRA